MLLAGTLPLLPLLLFLLPAALGRPGAEKNPTFDQFVAKYGKTYPSLQERERRRAIYERALRTIDELNAEDPTALYGATRYADWTPEEFADLLGGDPSQEAAEAPDARESARSGADPAPPTEVVDYEALGALSPVRDSGECKVSWAIATVGALETAYFMMHGVLINGSVQQILDCSESESNLKCYGGTLDAAIDYAAKFGLEENKDYPFQYYVPPFYNYTCQYDYSLVKIFVRRYTNKEKVSEEDLHAHLIAGNAPAVGVDSAAVQYYMGGIIDTLRCTTWKVTHAAQLVGYGYDEESGKYYWKLKNNRGIYFGEKGYFRLVYGKRMCAIGMQVVSPTVK